MWLGVGLDQIHLILRELTPNSTPNNGNLYFSSKVSGFV